MEGDVSIVPGSEIRETYGDAVSRAYRALRALSARFNYANVIGGELNVHPHVGCRDHATMV